MQHTATHTATYCNTLQQRLEDAINLGCGDFWGEMTLLSGMYICMCNTLQHTATHTAMHTATHTATAPRRYHHVGLWRFLARNAALLCYNVSRHGVCVCVYKYIYTWRESVRKRERENENHCFWRWQFFGGTTLLSGRISIEKEKEKEGERKRERA